MWLFRSLSSQSAMSAIDDASSVPPGPAAPQEDAPSPEAASSGAANLDGERSKSAELDVDNLSSSRGSTYTNSSPKIPPPLLQASIDVPPPIEISALATPKRSALSSWFRLGRSASPKTSLDSAEGTGNTTSLFIPEVDKASDKPKSRAMQFSLLECADLDPNAKVVCVCCLKAFTNFLVVDEVGGYWHSECFASTHCPEVSHRYPSSASGEESESQLHESLAIDESSSSSDTFVSSLDNDDERDDEEEDVADEEEERREKVTVSVAEAISWVIQRQSEENRGPDTTEQVSISADLANTDNPESPPPRDIDALAKLMKEIVGLDRFNYGADIDAASTPRSQSQIDHELELWSCAVGAALGLSRKLFPLEMYRLCAIFEGNIGENTLKVTSHASSVMRCIRLRFGITTEDFARSFPLGGIEGGGVGEGKSGNVIWFTGDRRFVLKTLSSKEFKFLTKILPYYYEHMVDNGAHTLLCRYMGIYSICINRGAPVRVVVMNNVFYHPPNPLARGANVVMDEVFDIKGSCIGRFVSKDDIQKGVTVMKDLNFCLNHDGSDSMGKSVSATLGPGRCRRLPLDPAFAALLRSDLAIDCAWLAERGIMDYSLLVGVGHLELIEIRPEPICDPINAATEAPSEDSISPSSSPIVRCISKQNSIHSSIQTAVQTAPWRSLWQEHWGGVSCVFEQAHVPPELPDCCPQKPYFPSRSRKMAIGEPGIIYLGIIDILQEFNMLKRIESAYKMKLLSTMGRDPMLISAIDAESYAERFQNFINSHL